MGDLDSSTGLCDLLVLSDAVFVGELGRLTSFTGDDGLRTSLVGELGLLNSFVGDPVLLISFTGELGLFEDSCNDLGLSWCLVGELGRLLESDNSSRLFDLLFSRSSTICDSCTTTFFTGSTFAVGLELLADFLSSAWVVAVSIPIPLTWVVSSGMTGMDSVTTGGVDSTAEKKTSSPSASATGDFVPWK